VVEKIETKKNLLEKKTRELNEAKRLIAMLDEIRKSCKRLRKELGYLEEVLPDKEEVPALLKDVTYAGKKFKIYFTLFEPEDIIVKEFYKELPIKLNIKCSFHNFERFLAALSGLSRVINPNLERIEGIGERELAEKGFRGETIKTELKLITFIYRKGSSTFEEEG
jgi:type IV pilus assembly protein PilO